MIVMLVFLGDRTSPCSIQLFLGDNLKRTIALLGTSYLATPRLVKVWILPIARFSALVTLVDDLKTYFNLLLVLLPNRISVLHSVVLIGSSELL